MSAAFVAALVFLKERAIVRAMWRMSVASAAALASLRELVIAKAMWRMSAASAAALASLWVPVTAKARLVLRAAPTRQPATTIPLQRWTMEIVSTWIHVVCAAVPARYTNAVVRTSQLAPVIAKAMWRMSVAFVAVPVYQLVPVTAKAM